MKKSLDHVNKICILGRVFNLRLICLSNGCFLSISEGKEERIGSLTLSMMVYGRVQCTSVIPEKRAGVFAFIISEMVASLTKGITIVSLYVASDIGAELSRHLLDEVKYFLKNHINDVKIMGPNSSHSLG